jgi:hypothetical protein
MSEKEMTEGKHTYMIPFHKVVACVLLKSTH